MKISDSKIVFVERRFDIIVGTIRTWKWYQNVVQQI